MALSRRAFLGAVAGAIALAAAPVVAKPAQAVELMATGSNVLTLPASSSEIHTIQITYLGHSLVIGRGSWVEHFREANGYTTIIYTPADK